MAEFLKDRGCEGSREQGAGSRGVTGGWWLVTRITPLSFLSPVSVSCLLHDFIFCSNSWAS
ncbi:hypothetical protein [Scytonema millei]|uniref:Uncharacterized protein n=1 Tax=Scytonema millei VB511283 TaxID=1245923 RepID=A0A9X5E3V6_9CYAN|nr:hypothetical protein [Scytonema millei]NHC34780.1 hypothetical protein [Scytonema millei VB511283]